MVHNEFDANRHLTDTAIMRTITTRQQDYHASVAAEGRRETIGRWLVWAIPFGGIAGFVISGFLLAPVPPDAPAAPVSFDRTHCEVSL